MLLAIVGKLLGTVFGLLINELRPESDYLIAGLVGIAPVWLELGATLLTGVEPSLERRSVWRNMDGAVDALCFVIVPTLWFGSRVLDPAFQMSPLQLMGLFLGLFVFVACGGFRLLRFLRYGLVDGQYFEGLPVTYTGYLWVVLVFFVHRGIPEGAILMLLLAGFAMVWKKLKVRRTQVPEKDKPKAKAPTRRTHKKGA